MIAAAVFPGQGFEQPDMARSWRSHPLLEHASRASAVDVRREIERWSPHLFRTSVLQPALVAASLAAWERVRALGLRVDVVAGHSEGEIAAWAASGAITHEDAVDLAAVRGSAMEREALAHPGGMVAVSGRETRAYALSLELVDRGALELGARNGPSAYVFTGETKAVIEVEAAGGRRLSASGPWHSRFMAGAQGSLSRALAKVPRRNAERMLVSGLDGAALVSGSPDLGLQLVKPVLWHRVMATLVSWGVTDIVTAGPGKVMRALVRDSRYEGRIWATDAEENIAELAAFMSA